MKIIDLTHTITEDMPVYPGTEEPALSPASSLERDGFQETLLHMYSHTGTHMDAPSHIYKNGKTLDAFTCDAFVGMGLVIDASALSAGDKIDMSFIERVREKADAAEFLLFRTGWEQYWGMPEYFGDYPVISNEVARYIVQSRKKGIGFDCIGLDPIADTALSLHHAILAQGNTLIIENLCKLSLLGDALFQFAALPLKYANADGAPIRAIGIL